MAFRSAIVGIISILSTLAPAGVPVALAHHDGGYGSYGEYGGYYSNSPQWEQPYYAPQTHRTTRRTTRRTSKSAQNGSMQKFRCYYKSKDGACMNYSYQHGPQWEDGIYPSQRYPFAAQSYGYDYPQGYNDQWNDEPYGYDYERNYRNNRNYNDRSDDDDCYTSRCEW